MTETARTPAVGVIGCGVISHAYFATILHSPAVRLKAVSSRTMASAEAAAARYGVTAMTTEALLADPEIEFVVNLAPPAVHYDIGRRVIEAGKHLYSEKPFVTRLDDAHALLALADARGVKIGCAPDTFLGEGHQAARRMIDAGVIGRVTGGAVAMASRGMEDWHPDPVNFYRLGGGPLLDIGPYYISQLVNLLGPVVEVVAIGTRPRDVGTITSPARSGQSFAVEVPTMINGAVLFASGANVAISLSWDVWQHERRPIELYGEDGSLLSPDPNGFDGAVRFSRGDGPWEVAGHDRTGPKLDAATLVAAVTAIGRGIDPRSGRPLGADNLLDIGDRRGLGLLGLVAAVADDREPRASGRLATHVLEVLLGLETSALAGSRVAIASRVDRPAAGPGA